MSAKNDKNWCARCGIWGDHTSGSCPDFAFHQRKQEEWKLKAKAPTDDANERGCWMMLLIVFLLILFLAALSGICSLITPEISQ